MVSGKKSRNSDTNVLKSISCPKLVNPDLEANGTFYRPEEDYLLPTPVNVCFKSIYDFSSVNNQSKNNNNISNLLMLGQSSSK